MPIGQTASTTVSLLNQGSSPIQIAQLNLSGQPFSVVGPTSLPITLAAGATYNLNIQFNPTAAGTASGQLTIANNSLTTVPPVINLSGTGSTSTGSTGAGMAELSALSCSSGSMTGSGTDACTVTLTAAAQSGGLAVNLSSSNSLATVPSSVTVPANSTSASFTASISSAATAQAVTMTASAGGVTKNFTLQLNAAIPTLSFSETSVAFGAVPVNTSATQSVILTSSGSFPVTISAATLTGTGFTISGTGFPITLSPGQATTLNVEFDPTVAGADTGQLTIASNSSTNSTAEIGLSGTGMAELSALSCSSGSMTGSGTDACTVTLTAAAQSGGVVVSLSSNSSLATVPSSVTVPASSTSASFMANISSAATAHAVTMTASAGGVTKNFTLQLNAAILALSINATSVAFGDVLINTSATQSVTMTSSGSLPVTLSAATLTGAGFTISGTGFPITLNPGHSTTLNVAFDPTVAGAATGQLTIASNSSTNSTAEIGLSGTGTTSAVVSVAVAPAAVTIAAGATQQFTASVTGTSNTTVNWTATGSGCSGAACGTISSGGLYMAPTTAPATALVTITATSVSDSSKSATAAVTIVLPSGATYYLAPAASGGNDANNGLSPGSPWLTPNHSLNCGDVVIAAASGSYSSSSFETGNWGTVNCPAGNNVAWLKCVTFDACKIVATTKQGMWVDQSYWGVQGWEVTAPASDASGTCFEAWPNYDSPIEIHHVIFANDIANGCAQGGIQAVNHGDIGVDYIAFIGNIAYNAAQGSATCSSGINIYQPVQSDSLPGTHIYVAGNFSWGNLNPKVCAAGPPTDGEGVLFDTFDGSQGRLAAPYSAQAVADNNIVVSNGGKGIEVYNNSAGSFHSPIYIRHNTSWGNLTDPNQSYIGCGEVTVNVASSTQVYENLISTKSATGCGANPIYPLTVTTGDATDQVDNNFAYGYSGYSTFVFGSGSFAIGPNNTFGMDPKFANPVTPPPPSCGGFTSVPACMATVISDFMPQNAAASGYGYQVPGTAQVYDSLFPQWLCNVNLPSGLVTMGCSPQP